MATYTIFTSEPNVALFDLSEFPEGALKVGLQVTFAGAVYEVQDWSVEVDADGLPIVMIKVNQLDNSKVHFDSI